MIQELPKYEEWLTTIANTRLIYNTMSELELMMDNHSIHSNGVRRSFPTPQKMRSAFRDLKVEVSLLTDNLISLDTLLVQYKKAWDFYHPSLSRRTDPSRIAAELLSYCYPPYQRQGLNRRTLDLFRQIADEQINVPLLVLMLLKAIPGYDSKGGDLIDMAHVYEQVMSFLEHYTSGGQLFNILPVITKAREENCKTRLMLIYHVFEILDTYEAYAESECLYDVSSASKETRIDVDIDGFWNECDGLLERTDFWTVEHALESGSYFITQWHKDACNQLIGIRYTMFLFTSQDGSITAYFVHPESIQHRMKGIPYGDNDHTWYKFPMPGTERPGHLDLMRLFTSSVWPQSIRLTRVSDEKVTSVYRRWIDQECQIVKPFDHLEYNFVPNLYAVTTECLFIPTGRECEYYRIPRTAHEGFSRIQLGDNVGTMTMNHRTYLVFDEFLLYIPTTQKVLRKYSIDKVTEIR